LPARVGIAVFPGTWSERDCQHAVSLAGAEGVLLWHKERSLQGCDLIILPGGFAHGDYLRAGAIAAFSPLMEEVKQFALAGGPVLGICNGFQILCEAKLLPGALLRNQGLQFRCQPTFLRVDSGRGPFLSRLPASAVLSIPISHGEGCYFADAATLDRLREEERIAFRYCSSQGELGADHNPNGSVDAIAGILNEAGNVLGMMPHPERACEPLLGSADGLALLSAVVPQLVDS
jgi:phosphoribosylformylglycinamidine synthase I